MTIEIIVERDSSPEEIEKAYHAISFGYRTTVFDYLRKNRINSYSKFAREAGCEYPEIVVQFIKNGTTFPTGKDLERLIDHIHGIGEWLKQIKHIQIHASVDHFEPLEYPDRPPSEEIIPKETDLAIREALTKMTWFYIESSKRFLKMIQGI